MHFVYVSNYTTQKPPKTTGCDGKLEQIFGPEARQKWPLLIIICQADVLNDFKSWVFFFFLKEMPSHPVHWTE